MNVTLLDNRFRQEQADVIRVLEHMLEIARAGHVSSVAIAYVRADRVTTSHMWSSSTCAPAQIGAIESMKMSMQLQALALASPNPDGKT